MSKEELLASVGMTERELYIAACRKMRAIMLHEHLMAEPIELTGEQADAIVRFVSLSPVSEELGHPAR